MVKKILILILFVWGVIGGIFYSRLGVPLMHASVLKDNYERTLVENPYNEEYQQEVKNVLKEYEDDMAASDEKFVSYFYSKNTNERAAMILFFSTPFLILLSILDSKLEEKRKFIKEVA